jgi:hypothetical protein
MDRGGKGAIMILALAFLFAASAPSGFVWHAANGPDSVQYGSPGSDFRALRIDCVDGRLSIGGPASHDAPEGTPTTVTFTTPAGRERRRATIETAGDGPNFFAPVAAGDPALRVLMRGQILRIRHGRETYQVPGRGSTALLRRLIRTCRR